MKILLLSQAKSISDQKSYNDAFQNAHYEGQRIELLNLPFLHLVEKYGWNGFYNEVVRANREFKPDLIYFQYFHCGGRMQSPLDCVRSLRLTENRPIIFSSLGDLFQNSFLHVWRRSMPRALVDMASSSDAFFSTFMGAGAEYLVQHGARNIIFLPHAYSSIFDERDNNNLVYDALMVGSVHISKRRFISSAVHYYNRLQIANQLWRRFGSRFGLYGKGWLHPAYVSSVEFRKQASLYRTSKMVVDARAPYDEVYYSSDRPFYIAGAGSVLVQYYTPRFEKLFKDGIHVHFVYKPNELISICDKINLMKEEDRIANLNQMSDLIRSRHMVENRVDTILSTYKAILDCRLRLVDACAARRSIRMWHFLPDIDLELEYNHCTANWVG